MSGLLPPPDCGRTRPFVQTLMMPKTSVTTDSTGTVAENAETMPENPARDTTATSAANTAEPINGARPNSCSSSAPTPADIIVPTPNRNSSSSTVTAPRSSGRSRRTTILSISLSFVSRPSRIIMIPVKNSSATATSSPATPFAPNEPKNCHSSCPETYPAPKKHPANARPKLKLPIFFIF